MGRISKEKVVLTNDEIVTSQIWLDQMSLGVGDFAFAWRLAQNLEPLTKISNDFTEARRKILNQFGAVIEDGKYKLVSGQYTYEPKENTKEATKALRELSELENEVEYYPIKFSKIVDKVKLADGQAVPMFSALKWMIVVDVDIDDEDEESEDVAVADA